VRGLNLVDIMNSIQAGDINGPPNVISRAKSGGFGPPTLQHAREALAKLDHLVCAKDLFVHRYAFHIMPTSSCGLAFRLKIRQPSPTPIAACIGARGHNPPGDASRSLVIQ